MVMKSLQSEGKNAEMIFAEIDFDSFQFFKTDRTKSCISTFAVLCFRCVL